MFHWVRNILKRDLDLLPSDSAGPTRSNTRAHSLCVCVSPEDNGSRLSRADEAAGSAHIFRDVRHSFRRAKKQIHVVVADTESDSRGIVSQKVSFDVN